MFGRKKNEPVSLYDDYEPEQPVREEKEPVFDTNRTVIGEGVVFEGDFLGSDPLELRGTIKGKLYMDSDVHVYPNAIYEGNADILNLYADGSISGELLVRNTANFSSSSSMQGSLTTENLITEKGSNFQGALTLEKTTKPPVDAQIRESYKKETAPAGADGSLEASDEEELTETDIFGEE